jgi:hypothetical protein
MLALVDHVSVDGSYSSFLFVLLQVVPHITYILSFTTDEVKPHLAVVILVLVDHVFPHTQFLTEYLIQADKLTVPIPHIITLISSSSSADDVVIHIYFHIQGEVKYTFQLFKYNALGDDVEAVISSQATKVSCKELLLPELSSTYFLVAGS